MARNQAALLLILAICISTSPANAAKLQKISPLYFNLLDGYSSESYSVRVWTGRTVPALAALCKGKYIAYVKDSSGTYFQPPSDCEIRVPAGIWVSNSNPRKVDTWVVVQKSSDPLPPLIKWLDQLEAGRFRKSGFQIVTPALLAEIDPKPLGS